VKFLDILKKPAAKVNVADIEAALENARADMVQALADRAAAESEYRSVLLDADSTLAIRAREKMSNAELAHDRAEAAVEALTIRLAEARERDEQDRRRIAYERAKAQADAAAKRLRDEYPKAAQAIVSIIVDLAHAENAVLEANAALPKGFAPLLAPEAMVRDEPATERKVLSEKIVERWVYVETGYHLSEELAKKVQPDGRGGHFISNMSRIASGGSPVAKREFIQVEFIPEFYGRAAAPLARSVSLPALAPDEIFWSALKGYGQASLSEIDHALSELAARQRDVNAKPTPHIEYVAAKNKSTASSALIEPEVHPHSRAAKGS